MILKNILFISTEFPPGPGGIGNHAWNLCNEIETYTNIHVLTVSNYVNQDECDKFDAKQKMYIFRFKKYTFSFITFIRRIYDIILHLKKYQYSHCLLSGRFSIYISIIISFLFRKNKIIGIFHGSELLPRTSISRFLLKNSLKRLDLFISVSNYTDNLLDNFSINKSIRHIISNGVNEQILSYKSLDKSIYMKGQPALLTVGSITDRKGQINLVKILPSIILKYPKVHYHCIGMPFEGKNLLNVANSLGIKSHITIHGYLSNEQLYEYYMQSDILIMLSQNTGLCGVEGFGIAILEANLFGISAIGSRNTGIADAIVHNKTGLLVDPYNKQEILESIDHILSNKEVFSEYSIMWSKAHNWGGYCQ